MGNCVGKRNASFESIRISGRCECQQGRRERAGYYWRQIVFNRVVHLLSDGPAVRVLDYVSLIKLQK